MATMVGCGGIRLASFNNLSPIPPIRRKALADISYRIQIIALLSQILLPWQPGLGVNLNDTVRLAIPENHT